MPTYEYRCNACEAEFEIQKRMSDPVETACPQCGSGQTQRLISHSSFVLKGSGWYVTDYARKNGAPGGGGGTHKDPAHVSPETAATAADAKPPASPPATAPSTAPAPAAAAKPPAKTPATAPASPSSSHAG